MRRLVDAAAARCHLEAGQTRQAEELIATLPDDGPSHTLLRAPPGPGPRPLRRLEAGSGRASPSPCAYRLTGEPAAGPGGHRIGSDAAAHMAVAVRVVAPEHLVRGAGMKAAAAGGPGGRRIARHRIRHRFVGALGSPPASADPHRQPAVILTERSWLALWLLPSHLTSDRSPANASCRWTRSRRTSTY